MKLRHTTSRRRNQVIVDPKHAPQPLDDDHVRCAGCGAVVALTTGGHMRAHRMPNGDDCAHRAVYGQAVTIEELPVPAMRPDSGGGAPIISAVPGKPALDVGSLCQDCRRWLPGERRLCGRCARQDGRR